MRVMKYYVEKKQQQKNVLFKQHGPVLSTWIDCNPRMDM